ncbi:Cof-like hydrolase [Spirochaeta thermophila DSM 6192]|uniref:Cof-like hydrolase n=1 Tax=Winmispira thermophila (strain ATCC 49972 / DSM 6192 / RI 19.B1) TaxID=665571 RepID=E0RQ27_WINT6|nr:Cof-like hydrolase [Spirochaeta thermophila DSM 6192]
MPAGWGCILERSGWTTCGKSSPSRATSSLWRVSPWGILRRRRNPGPVTGKSTFTGTGGEVRWEFLLACDLDDTLLSGDGVLPEEDLRLLRRAVRCGILPVVASGRPFASVRRVVEAFWPDVSLPFIAFNGALVGLSGTGTVLFSRRVPRVDACRFLEWAERHGLFAQTYDEEYFYVPSEDDRAERYARNVGIPYRVVGPLSRFLSFDPPKVLLHDDPIRLEEHYPEALRLFGDRLSLFFSKPQYLEVVHPEVDKGMALAWVAERYGVPRARVVAMGDSGNDVEMVRWAGTGVAVANARQEVKEVASVVTGAPGGEGALREVFERCFPECLSRP